MVSAMLGVCYNIILAPYPYPSPLTLRRAVLHTDMTSSSVLNSQFFVSIFNLTQKLALG